MVLPGARVAETTAIGHPTSFADRGLAVPFTTPSAFGARVRAGPRAATEYVLPHPAAQRGVYVVARPGLARFCRLTMHDHLLDARLADGLPDSVGRMRILAAEVAAGGTAGREAAAAARSVLAQDEMEHAAGLGVLQTALLRQMQLADGRRRDASLSEALAMLGERAGAAPGDARNALSAIARLFVGFGLGKGDAGGRLDRAADALLDLRRHVATWDVGLAPAGEVARGLLPVVAALFEAGARRSLREARARLTDLPGLIGAQLRDRFTLGATIGRAPDFLDGWAPVCALAALADADALRHGLASELIRLLPVLPTEAETLVPAELRRHFAEAQEAAGKIESGAESFVASDLVARNEQVRAIAC